jgi:hypothetical protein
MSASLRALETLHRQVDDAAASCAQELSGDFGHPSRCGRGCSGCCQDDLTVFEIEAQLIRAHHAQLLAEGRPGPVGHCAFLGDDGGCRIYAQRPYVCRTQGLPLRWLEPDGDGGGLEYRDICPLNECEDGVPIVELPPEALWTLGPWEDKLRLLQELRDGGEGWRVTLRDLFSTQG